jgi:hypothetical protein
VLATIAMASNHVMQSQILLLMVILGSFHIYVVETNARVPKGMVLN